MRQELGSNSPAYESNYWKSYSLSADIKNWQDHKGN